MKRHYKIPFGAEVERDGVRFRLWAPRAARASLHLEGDPVVELPMERKTDGTFVLTTAVARSGTRYRYLADGNPYPDPASRRQPDGVHGPSEVVDPLAYDSMAEATFLMPKLDWSEPSEVEYALWLDHYRVLALRAVTVKWQLGDGMRLLLCANFSERAMQPPDTAEGWQLLYSSDAPGAPISASFLLLGPAVA